MCDKSTRKGVNFQKVAAQLCFVTAVLHLALRDSLIK